LNNHHWSFISDLKTLNYIRLVQVFERGVTQDQVILMAARASRIENQDAIDTAIVGMLADPKEV
jgi:hypothetical protein